MPTQSNVLNILKALSDRNRLLVIYALQRHRKLCACRITEFLGVAGATTSRHLALLVNAGLLSSRKKGRWVYYSLNEMFSRSNQTLFEWLKQELNENFLTSEEAAKLKIAVTTDEEELCRRQRVKNVKEI